MNKRITAVLWIVSLSFPGVTLGEGRLLLSGPRSVPGDTFNGILEVNLSTGNSTVFAEFPTHPIAMAECPDGLLYVGLEDGGGIQKLDPQTGEFRGLIPIPTIGPVAMLCLPDGTLLFVDEAGPQNGTIKHFDSCGIDMGNWAEGFDVVRSLQLTSTETVAFTVGHADQSTRIVEYDLDGNFLRDVIPLTADGINDFLFSSSTEILVYHRDSECIMKYDWTDGALVDSGFICDSEDPKVDRLGAGWLARHPGDGSIFSAHIQGGCIWAWDAEGVELNDGEPVLGDCDPPNFFVQMLIYADKTPGCKADLDGDGDVDAADLAILLGNWGDCAE